MAADGPQILLVDRDTAVRRAIQLLLRGHGYDVRAYPDIIHLIGDAQARHAALLLADESLAPKGRIGLLNRLRADGWAGTALLMAREDGGETAWLAQAQGFHAMLAKPLRPTVLLREVAAARSRGATTGG